MIAGDRGSLFINQGWRPAVCLGVQGDRALVEYTMPAGSTTLLEMPAEWTLKGRTAWPAGSHNVTRNISANRLPKRWKEVLA